MWSPEEDLPHRAGRALESDLSLRYLAPGAFTILPPGKDGPPPDPPSATNRHRLTPTTKKNRNAAFTIIAEPGSNAGSRSPSPTGGRVSPFRGRGFNPTGSRHVSPLPSPPPEERRFPSSRQRQPDATSSAAKRSKIPTLSRRGSTAALFGDQVEVEVTSPGRTKRANLTKQLSQSLTNISPRHVSYKPPPSPRRARRHAKPPAFQKLSPIIGSSPEPTPNQHRLQSPSSPSKIPRSRSQPPSTRISPNASKVTSRGNSRNPSRNASRNPSRDPSPNKLTPKPSYKNVRAKVNSFNTIKPKVLPKPQVPKTNEKQKLERKDSVIRSTRANDNNSNDNTTNTNSSKISNNNSNSKNDDSNKNRENNKSRNKSATPSTSKGTTKAGVKSDLEKIRDESSTQSTPDHESSPVDVKSKTQKQTETGMKNVESTPKLVDLLSPSTTAVVSSTTTTVTQPLKIEAKLDVSSKYDDKGDSSYLPDARALSATSVSTAMNRMNDTVLDTKTLMKDTNMSSRLSPAANTIIGMSNNGNNNSQKPGEKVTNTESKNSALPPVETVSRNNNNNHNDPFGPEVTHNYNSNVSPLNSNNNSKSTEVKSNDTNVKTNGISPERGVVVGLSALPKSENERIKEARTMVATDVQPIRITVKEKPSNVEVQSGNVRLPVSATNGINERPGLPPSQPPQEGPPGTPEPAAKGCGRLLGCCKKKPKTETPHTPEKKKKLWCFSKNKKETEQMPDRISSDASLIEDEENQKKKWWKKMKCCKRNKVADTTGCFPTKQRKNSWAERADSITSEIIKKSPKDRCKDFLRTIFCINLCARKRRKEQEEAINRRASLMSKKKSLTPPVAQEELPKLDAGLVEHTSLMKGAIPVLPVPLAWMCLVLNVFLPGTGTIISGFLCLCMGKPRFSTKDGAKQRVGACIIDFFIGCGQLFTVLFCLVGWGWSIWWGVIMIKVAKKYRKIRRAEQAMQDDMRAQAAAQTVNENHLNRDPERGS